MVTMTDGQSLMIADLIVSLSEFMENDVSLEEQVGGSFMTRSSTEVNVQDPRKTSVSAWR